MADGDGLARWEIGTHLEALLVFSFPSLSAYSESFDKISPSTSPLPTQVMSTVSYLVAQSPPSSSQLQIVRDGSAADPVSIAPFYVLSNFTLENAQDTLPTNSSDVQGARKETVEEAVENQVEAILQRTPRTSDGAISHRTETTELWSDFVCKCLRLRPLLVVSRASSSSDDFFSRLIRHGPTCELYAARFR